VKRGLEQKPDERHEDDFSRDEERDDAQKLANVDGRAVGGRHQQRAQRLLPNATFTYVCEPKIDGLSMNLVYENGRLTRRIVEQEKLRRDLALAAEVQKRLLPDGPPATSLATLAAVSLPARTVGGDYFDFIDVGDQRIGIALADVAGKGVAAALIMSSVQASLRILSADTDLSLPQLAAKMNRFLHESTGAKSYATFFYAQLEQGSRRLRYVNAGHLPPYLLRSAASIEELTTGGAVIGLFPQMAYDEGTADLEPGDVLVAFTDGVTEAMNASEEEFGEERLKDLLRQIVHLPVDEISARISEALKKCGVTDGKRRRVSRTRSR
jgi:sigma-B regulation protein RsbU (phosphoserine phosphatase)